MCSSDLCKIAILYFQGFTRVLVYFWHQFFSMLQKSEIEFFLCFLVFCNTNKSYDAVNLNEMSIAWIIVVISGNWTWHDREKKWINIKLTTLVGVFCVAFSNLNCWIRNGRRKHSIHDPIIWIYFDSLNWVLYIFFCILRKSLWRQWFSSFNIIFRLISFFKLLRNDLSI